MTKRATLLAVVAARAERLETEARGLCDKLQRKTVLDALHFAGPYLEAAATAGALRRIGSALLHLEAAAEITARDLECIRGQCELRVTSLGAGHDAISAAVQAASVHALQQLGVSGLMSEAAAISAVVFPEPVAA